MECNVCGSKVNIDEDICKVCGAPLEKDATESEKTGIHAKNLQSLNCPADIVTDDSLKDESGWNTLNFPIPKNHQILSDEHKKKEAHESFDYVDYKFNRLFLFSRENEEIQKILDEEFDRITKLNISKIEGKAIPLWKTGDGTAFELSRDTIPINPKDVIKAATAIDKSNEERPQSSTAENDEKKLEQADDVVDEEKSKPNKQPQEGEIPPIEVNDLEKETNLAAEEAKEEIKEDTKEEIIKETAISYEDVGPTKETPKDIPKKRPIWKSKASIIALVLLVGVAITIIGLKFLHNDFFEGIIGETKGTFSESKGFSKAVENKGLLIERAWNSNQNLNIKNISANDALEYSPGRDYGDEGINFSRPLGNNTWIIGEGDQPRYYDQEAVRTLISFNSQWIDYVNNRNETVFAMVKQESPAYEKLIQINPEDRPEEIMLKLDIGEIRRWKNSFYVWTYEQLMVKQDEDDVINNFRIYRIDIVGKQMQIADYTEY